VVEAAAALSPPERKAVATLAVVYAVRMLGLFLLLPVLALYAGSMPGGTPLLAGLAVGAYGLTQALLQIPFGVWSDRLGRRPLIMAGLLLHIGGSALGYFAATAWALIAARIVQLGGAPDMNPDVLLSQSHSEYVEGEDLVDMIREDLVAERIAIDSYREMIEYLGDDDPTTRRRLEEILATEEGHADDLRMLTDALSRDERRSLRESGGS